jgi:hypothetical protein
MLIEKILIIFNKLVKLYGRKNVFLAICDVYDMDTVNLNNPYPLLVYFLKKRLDADSMTLPIYLDVTNKEKEIEKARKRNWKIEDPFDE